MRQDIQNKESETQQQGTSTPDSVLRTETTPNINNNPSTSFPVEVSSPQSGQNSSKQDQAQPSPAERPQYADHLNTLAEMGFLNVELSSQLLETFKGDIQLVVQQYLRS